MNHPGLLREVYNITYIENVKVKDYKKLCRQSTYFLQASFHLIIMKI